MNRFMKAFIAVSVLLNLLLAGIVIGDAGHYFVGRHRHLTVQEIAMALPVAKREHVKASIAGSDQEIAALRRQLDEAREKAADLLKAPVFNAAAYARQIQVIQQLKTQILQRMGGAIINLAAQATPQERAAMVDTLCPQKAR